MLSALQAVDLLKNDIVKMYSKKGPAVVAMNHSAVDQSVSELVKIDVPAAWKGASGEEIAYGSGVETKYMPDATSGLAMPVLSNITTPEFKGQVPFDDPQVFVKEIMGPVLALEGDDLPVSAFTPDGM